MLATAELEALSASASKSMSMAFLPYTTGAVTAVSSPLSSSGTCMSGAGWPKRAYVISSRTVAFRPKWVTPASALKP